MLRSLLVAGLALLVALLPLPFGAVSPGLEAAAGLWAGLLLVGWAVEVSRSGLMFRDPLLLPPAALTLIVILWAAAQIMIPVAPDPLRAAASATLGLPARGRISLAPDASTAALIPFLLPLGIFWLALQLGRDRQAAFQLLHTAAWSSAAYALYGILNYAAGNHLLLWLPRTAYPDDITGTLVNRNSFATEAGLGLLAATTLCIATVRHRFQATEPVRSRIVRLAEALPGRPALMIMAALVIAMAWLQSHSRMGFAATVLGLLTLCALHGATSAGGHRRLPLPLLLVCGAALVAVSGAGTLQRIGETDHIDRLPIFATAIRAIDRASWVGTGLGTFPDAFRAARDLSLPQRLDYSHAHNSYLELAVELGIPATVLLVLAIGWMAGLCLVGAFRRQRDRGVPMLGFAATVLVGTHALTDFSLQIPAVAALFALLLGIGVAQSFSTYRLPSDAEALNSGAPGPLCEAP